MSAHRDLALCKVALAKLQEVADILGQVEEDPPGGWCAGEASYHLEAAIGMLEPFGDDDEGDGEPPQRPRLTVVGRQR